MSAAFKPAVSTLQIVDVGGSTAQKRIGKADLAKITKQEGDDARILHCQHARDYSTTIRSTRQLLADINFENLLTLS